VIVRFLFIISAIKLSAALQPMAGVITAAPTYKISQTQKSLKSFDWRLFTFVAGEGLEPTTFGLVCIILLAYITV